MTGIERFSARKRAAIRVCVLLAPLAAASACRSGDESAVHQEAPAPTVASAAGARAKGEEGSMGRASNTEGGFGSGVRPSMAPILPGRAGTLMSGLSGGAAFSGPLGSHGASRPRVDAAFAAAPAMQDRSAPTAAIGRALAKGAPGDPLATAANGPVGLNSLRNPPKAAATFGMIGLLGHGAPSASAVPAAPWGREEEASQPVTPAPTRLDPNARYATTYRPGGAALAAFDAAVSRGQIPASCKDLVGDFGARYAPNVAAPKEGALAVGVDTTRAAIGPEGGALNLRVALASSEAMPTRAPLSVHIVLDVSGSMSGQAIDDAKRAAEAAVGKLESTDDFSMVTFSDTASVIVPDGPIGPRRDKVLARIHEVQAGGGTNISAGLDLGYAEARTPSAGDEAVRLVMLLSDGHANGGDTSPEHLADRAARAFQDGVETSTFGLGPDYDAALMSGIADRGAGGYYYVADSSQIEPDLAREIDARLRPVATAVELRVRLRPDVGATHVFGSRELTAVEADAVRAQEVAVDQHEKQHGIASDRQVDAAGGMRFFIPAFARADRHATLITLELPPGTGDRRIASVEVRYKDRLLKKNVTQELPVNLRWAASDAESALTVDHDVERAEQAFAAGEAILEAAGRVDAGDRAGARHLLDERAAVLRIASSTLGDPRFLEDAARLDRLGDAIGGAQMAELPLVVMLRGSGYGYL
jgi:Ca-activated chloride channel family protein